jgi:hypothetical protein
MILFPGRAVRIWLYLAAIVAVCGALFLVMFPLNPPRKILDDAAVEDSGTAGFRSDVETKPSHLLKPPRPPSDYLGSASCAECHPKIAHQYASHSMAKSMAEIAAAPALEEFGEQATFSPDERHIYQVEKTATGTNHHERFLDIDGQVIYDQSVQIDYEVGSGVHGRSYLIQREGAMFMSPISWYSKAHRWNLSPGYKLPVHRRFERRVTSACLNCHVGRLNELAGQNDHFGKSPFLETSIGCERCHGPGGRHVAFHRASLVAGEIDPIVNPAKLDFARREDVCSQCHLQGEGRIPNYGCEVGDFRPGQRLEETAVVFVKGTHTTAEGKSRAVSHVDQMRSSVCYQKSAGRLGCISCHDPHSMPAEREKTAFYRSKCLSCHEQQGCRVPESDRRKRSANDSCIECHMPSRGASDIPHTSHTDHRLLRVPVVAPTESPTSPELPVMFDSAESRLSQLTIDRARGLWLAEHAEMRTDRQMALTALGLLENVAKQLPDDADVLDGLGTASAVAGRLDDSVKFWKQALELEPKRDLTLRTTALTLQNTKRVDEAIPLMEKYLEIQPWNASMWGRYSNIQGMSGNWQKALEAAKRSEQIDPSTPRIYQWLSKVYQELGDQQQSQHYQNLFDRIKPQGAK